MLVHVTRFVDVQEHVFVQVSDLLRDFKDILAYGEEGSSAELLNELRHLWDGESEQRLNFVQVNDEISDDQCPRHTWAEVSAKILSVTQSIKVRRINGSAGDVLDYEQHKRKGLNVIAIGGDKLSRGLTLEGLIVSYFTRPSRMYDTLMQMGRWFGYRDGFIDICRLYAPQGLISWFQHITDASEELRKEFLLMCEMGDTPATYGQRVQSHPVLMVTSQVKMRHSYEHILSYQGARSETIVYSRVGREVDGNYHAAVSLLEKISGYAKMRQSPVRKEASERVPGKHLWLQVKPEDVLEFLRQYTPPSQHVRKVNTTLLAEYIEKQLERGDLESWSVLLAGKNPHDSQPCDFGIAKSGLIERSNHPKFMTPPSTEPNAYRTRQLVSPQDESWDLTQEQYQRAIELGGEGKKGSLIGPKIRVARDKNQALLILYPLAHQDHTAPIGSAHPYIGFAISFPGNKKDKPVKYRVNSVYQGQMDE
jgi:hypothetical protein